MDVIFDIDGTLADASHRLHFIKQPAEEMRNHVVPDFKPDWDSFLSDEQVAKDSPIQQTCHLLMTMLDDPDDYRIIFITGRNKNTQEMTLKWLGALTYPVRTYPPEAWIHSNNLSRLSAPILYMRPVDDRRPSDKVKRDLLNKARADGFNPTLVFEDRKEDTAMWRSEGLLCCQVAEGDY